MEPKYAGEPLRLGGKQYILPPLNLAALERYWPVIETPPEKLLESLLLGTEMLHAALTRNYPELTLAEVKEAVDLKNFPEIFEKLLEASGLKRRVPGEPEAGSAPTGATSTGG